MKVRQLAAIAVIALGAAAVCAGCSTSSVSPSQAATIKACHDIRVWWPNGNPLAVQANQAETDATGTPLANDLQAWFSATFSGVDADIPRARNTVAADCLSVSVKL